MVARRDAFSDGRVTLALIEQDQCGPVVFRSNVMFDVLLGD
jgi:hypothetical protein